MRLSGRKRLSFPQRWTQRPRIVLLGLIGANVAVFVAQLFLDAYQPGFIREYLGLSDRGVHAVYRAGPVESETPRVWSICDLNPGVGARSQRDGRAQCFSRRLRSGLALRASPGFRPALDFAARAASTSRGSGTLSDDEPGAIHRRGSGSGA